MIDLLLKALSFYGTKEIEGGNHNHVILGWFKDIGHAWVKNDELAWCSTFVNAMAKYCGYEWTGKLNARSWLDIGEALEFPEPGCIVVFHRKGRNSPYGHVGLFVSDCNGMIYVLGGNQSNQVCIAPYHKNKVLSYRKLNKNATKNS